MFGNKAKNRKSLNKINNSKESLSLIKDTAINKSNWKGKDVLVLRLAFGAMQKSDALLALGDEVENGVLDFEQELFSKEEKDEPCDKFRNKRASQAAKDRPTMTHVFLERL